MVEFLISQAKSNFTLRARLCAHRDINDPVHEMIIVHHLGNYIAPHRHIDKTESFHIIRGRLAVVLFTDEGNILDKVLMTAEPNAGCFYYRLQESLFHTVVPLTDTIVFHETTTGPFYPGDMIVPEWAPTKNDVPAFQSFLASVVNG